MDVGKGNCVTLVTFYNEMINIVYLQKNSKITNE